MLLPLCWKRNNLYAFWIPIRFANIDTMEFLSKLITIVIWTLDTWNLMSGKKSRLSREDARRRRTRKKWYLENVVRLRGTWSEGPRGEGGCLELPGALRHLFPETLALEALWVELGLDGNALARLELPE